MEALGLLLIALGLSAIGWLTVRLFRSEREVASTPEGRLRHQRLAWLLLPLFLLRGFTEDWTFVFTAVALGLAVGLILNNYRARRRRE